MPAPLALTRLSAAAEDSAPRILQPQRLAQLIETARAEGQERGRAEAEAASAAQHGQALAVLAEAISDATLTHGECRRTMRDALQPLLTAMIERVLPGLATDGFASLVARQVMDLAEPGLDAPLRLRCHPEAVPSLERALAELTLAPPGVKIAADPGLDPLKARIEAGAHERRIDIDAALDHLRTLSAELIGNARAPQDQESPDV